MNLSGSCNLHDHDVGHAGKTRAMACLHFYINFGYSDWIKHTIYASVAELPGSLKPPYIPKVRTSSSEPANLLPTYDESDSPVS